MTPFPRIANFLNTVGEAIAKEDCQSGTNDGICIVGLKATRSMIAINLSVKSQIWLDFFNPQAI